MTITGVGYLFKLDNAMTSNDVACPFQFFFGGSDDDDGSCMSRVKDDDGF